MSDEKIVEVMARAFCRALDGDPDILMPDWARDGASDALAGLRHAGYAVVPVEPTDDMVCHQTYTDGEWNLRNYAAMIAAATHTGKKP